MIGALAGSPSPVCSRLMFIIRGAPSAHDSQSLIGEPPCPNMREPPYIWRLAAEAAAADRVCRSSCLWLNLLGSVVLEADGRGVPRSRRSGAREAPACRYRPARGRG